MAKSYNRKINLYINGKEVRRDLVSIKREYYKLINAQARMIEGSDEYVAAGKKIRYLKNIISKHNQQLRETKRSWLSLKNVSSKFNQYFGVITAGIAAVTGAFFSAKEWVKGLVNLDDSLSDVMKTTGMTRKSVRGLYDDFRYLNTRTPRKELLMLAEEAGRLGKKSKRDVMAFVEVANKIKVSLGDDLGGDAAKAIKEVGKLVNIYRIGEQYGSDFGKSMEKVGSGLNEVSANSSAQASYLIDYLKRMGGVAVQAKLSAAEVLGYGSALDQLGQAQEMAATAHGKVMIDMFTNHAEYAKIAGVASEDFLKLLEEDANAAFLKFLEGLNGSDEGLAVLSKKLDALGIDGARATQVLSTLASNVDLVREEQELANSSMEKGTSLTEEYNVKNESLAASWDKLGRYIKSKFINSGMLKWLEGVVGKMGAWTEVSIKDKLRSDRLEMNSLVMKVVELSEGTDRRRMAMERLVEAYPRYFGSLDVAKAKNSELLSVLRQANRQMIRQIFIAGRREELKALQKNAAEKLAVEVKYNEQLQGCKARVISKMKKDQQLMLANDFDFIMHYYKKLKKKHGDGVKLHMAASQWLEKNNMHVSQGGLTTDDLNALLNFYEMRRAAYKERYQAEKAAREEETSIRKYEKRWLEDSTTSVEIPAKITPKKKPQTISQSATKEQAKVNEKVEKLRDELFLSQLKGEAREVEAVKLKYKRLEEEAKAAGGSLKEIETLKQAELVAIGEKYEQKRRNTIDRALESFGKVNLNAAEMRNAAHEKLLESYSDDLLTQEEFKMAELELEIKYLLMRREEVRNNSEELMKIEEELNEKKQEMIEEANKSFEDLGNSSMGLDDDLLDSELAYLDGVVAAHIKASKAIAKEIEKRKKREEEENEHRKDVALDMYQSIGEVVGSMVLDTENAFDNLGKSVVLIAFRVLRGMVPVWTAKIVGESLSTPDSVLTFGASGLARAAIITGLLEGAISVAEGAVRSSMKGKKEGGWTGWSNSDDEIKDYVHANEYVLTAESVRKIFPVVAALDDRQKSGTIHQIDVPTIVSAINGGSRAVVAPSKGVLSSGSDVGEVDGVESVEPHVVDETMLIVAVARMNKLLERLERDGVSAEVALTGRRGLIKQQERYDGLRREAGFK